MLGSFFSQQSCGTHGVTLNSTHLEPYCICGFQLFKRVMQHLGQESCPWHPPPSSFHVGLVVVVVPRSGIYMCVARERVRVCLGILSMQRQRASVPISIGRLCNGHGCSVPARRLPSVHGCPSPVGGLPLDMGTHIHWGASQRTWA